MSERQFNSIISLGTHCLPSDHYRRFFKQEPSSPFDWMITPIPSLIKILEDDGKQFGLKITPAMDSTSALCVNYGCYYHHEFEKTPENKIIVTEEALRACREKLSYKYQKMLSIARDSQPLFVHWMHSGWHPANPEKENFIFTADEVRRLQSLLEEKLQHSNFHIAFITTDENPYQLMNPELFISVPNISIRSYSEKSAEEVDLFWNELYTSYGFTQSKTI
jgi:hypothetical protein